MADIKGTPDEEFTTQTQSFPEVKGKIVDSVAIIVEADHYGIDIRFQDKTGLAFSIESSIVTFPTYADWTDGEGEPIKQYDPMHSKGLRS